MTSQSPRDPGKIAQAFNSLGLEMKKARLRAPHDPAKDATYIANNPESEAAMRAEASRGKTSRRSPARPSAAMRRSLTGVTEHLETQGWLEPATALPHLCFPPDQYPQGCGPGSQWACRCDAVWVAEGIAWEDYPTTPKRLELLKPERWHYVGGGQLATEDYRAQENLYDWRPLGPYYVRLYRAMIDNQVATMEGRMRDTTTWQELG